MKKILTVTAIFVFILFLTKVANQMPPDPPPGTSFSLKAQQVMQCTPDQITLVDNHQVETHLNKDGSWPDCSDFRGGEVIDFYLSRGERTHFLSYDDSPWWRKSM